MKQRTSKARTARGAMAALLLASFAAMSPAHAQSTVTIDVTGNIVGGSCAFRNDGNVVINLGTVQARSFAAVGSASPWVAGNLISDGCTGVATIDMTFSAQADTANAALYAVSGGASGVGVELQTEDGRAAVPNGTTPLAFTPQPAGGAYPFRARYVRTGTVSAGGANARVTVNITYL